MRVAIVGAGAAGIAAASAAAKRGVQVTLVEAGRIGGNGWTGDLLGSKVFLEAAAGGEKDLNAIWRRRLADEEEVTGRLREELDEKGIRSLSGRATFRSPAAMEVGGKPLPADGFILATGSRPRMDSRFPYDGERVFTTRDALRGGRCPGSILVVGSGPSGTEYAHLYAAFGARVTLLASREHLLPWEDPDVAAAVTKAFRERGIGVETKARVENIQVEGEGVRATCADGREFSAEAALLAIGEEANVADLNLAAGGLSLDEKGRLPAGKWGETSVPGVYVAGDLTGRFRLASVAARQGEVAVGHLLGEPVEPLDYSGVVAAVFSEPQVASCGVTETVATWRRLPVRIWKVELGGLKLLLTKRAGGFCKVTVDEGSGVVLGASVVGGEAAELAGALSLAVRAKMTAGDLVKAFQVTPSWAENLGNLCPVG